MKQFRAQIIMMMMMMMMMMTCCFASISRANVRRTLNKAGVLPVHLFLELTFIILDIGLGCYMQQ